MSHWKRKQVPKISEKSFEQEVHAENEDLIAAIFCTKISGSTAHKRCCPDQKLCEDLKTLDQLTSALDQDEYELERSAVCLHFLPKNSQSKVGQQNVTTALHW